MKFWFDTFRSRLLLTFVTYALYMLLYIATDGQSREFYSGGNPLPVYLLDVAVTLVCIFLFVQLSIFYSRIVYCRFVFTARPYISLMAYSLILLLLNNAMAYLLSVVTGWLFEMDNLPFLQVQHIYVYAILSTFISSVYTNAHYLYAYITAEDEKKRLEILAMQAKLNALKQQIDPHFMFNNFSILSELIVEDRRLAVKFLDKLSKVYRYVIQNYDRDTVSVADELAFLDSYLYLMEMRYEGAVAVSVSSELRHAEGRIPPVCLQLLVENAVKHSVEECGVRTEIVVGCHEIADGVLLSVANTGSAFPDDIGVKLKEGRVSSSTERIGLQNIDERLHLLFGEEYGLQFRNENGWAIVSFVVPGRKDAHGNSGR